MSRLADIKIRLAPDLKRRFDSWCRETGTTMTTQLVWLIQSVVDNEPLAAVPESSKETAFDRAVDRQDTEDAVTSAALMRTLVAVEDRVENLVEAHPQYWFENWFAKRAAQDGQAINQLGRRQSEHHAAANEAMRGLRAHITSLAQTVQLRDPPFYKNYKIWSGAGFGALSLLLVLALLPGESAISRRLAIKMVGGANPIHAAEVIVGGNALRGELIFETAALMQSEPFASSYAECVQRAKRNKKALTCTLKFPAIVQTK
jgi:hypothetical protein